VSPRARLLLAVAALATAAPAVARADGAADAPPTFAADPSGRRFRIAFDPESRVTLGAAVTAARGPKGGPVVAPEIDAGIAYRSTSARGAGRDRVAWEVEHRILTGWARPLGGPERGVPAFDAALYDVSIHRHDASPSLVLPMSPPVGVPFPFDVGFDATAGRVAVTAVGHGARAPVLHVGVARAALLLDPWRSGVTGRFFTFGLGARYDVDVEGGPTLAAPRLVHRVAPMTAGSLRFRLESRDGLTAVDARAEVAPHWSSLGAWAVAAQGGLHLERALLAVQDQPIAAVLEGGYRFDPRTHGAPATSDLRVSLGLAWSLPFSR
jgi:hypothetical protein